MTNALTRIEAICQTPLLERLHLTNFIFIFLNYVQQIFEQINVFNIYE